MNSESARISTAGQAVSARPQQSRLEQKTLITLSDSGGMHTLPRRDRSVLVRLDSAEAGKVITPDTTDLRIGRNPDNLLVIDDEGLSRFHARLYKTEEHRYFLEDLGSSNGTFVNGARITTNELLDGSTIQLGPRVSFRFSIVDEQQERVLRQLYQSSVRDGLTGAYNRRYFADRLEAEIAYAVRHRSNAALILFDVDHFKQVNDRYGHQLGDEALRVIATTVSRAMRAEELFARYGGEEFVGLLRGVALSGAAKAGERLRRLVEATPIAHDGTTLQVTVSVGAAALTCCEQPDARQLIAIADRRLYLAKQRGRNRVVAEG